MRIDVISLFPEFIQQCVSFGVVGRAVQRELLQVEAWNPRDFAFDNYRTIDHRPYGGGPGMVMMVEPLRLALAEIRKADERPVRTIYLSPQGRPLTQQRVRELALVPRLALLCGRYEGVDERLLQAEIDEEISVGDYVLSGGELAAAVLIDAIGRLQDGALNAADSATQDSFENGLLDCPHYTRPERDESGEVPAVLLSGDHKAIARWRRMQSLGRTWLRRPDLLDRLDLSAGDRQLLELFRAQRGADGK